MNQNSASASSAQKIKKWGEIESEAGNRREKGRRRQEEQRELGQEIN